MQDLIDLIIKIIGDRKVVRVKSMPRQVWEALQEKGITVIFV
jgi:hypothetical protein